MLPYDDVFRYAPMPVIIADVEGCVVAVNRCFEETFGYPAAEAQGRRLSAITHPDDLPEHHERLQKLRHGELDRARSRKRYVTKDGRTLWGESTVATVPGPDGRPAFFVAHVQDVTEEQSLRDSALESETRMQAILDNTSAIIFVKDLEGRYTLVNKRFEILHKLVRGEVLGRSDADLFPGKIARSFLQHDRLVMAGGSEVQTEEELTFGREKHTFITMKFPLRNLEGQIVGVCGISTDITTRKRAETRLRILNERLVKGNEELKTAQMQLIQAEKLESIGRLAAGVAHEVKNPLALLLMGVEYLEANVPTQDEAVPMILTEMREAITRAEKIIVGMVDFSSNRDLDRQECDLNDLLSGAEMLVKHELTRHSISVRHQIEKPLPRVWADRTKIEQVLVNLLMNALQAIKRQGRITISTSTRLLGDEERRSFGTRTANPFRTGDRVISVEIHDTGPGIPPEILPKIFDPFFTTKPTGEGTGLGLSVVRKIVDLHEGHIEIMNAPEGGCLVTLVFKTADATMKTAVRPAEPASVTSITQLLS